MRREARLRRRTAAIRHVRAHEAGQRGRTSMIPIAVFLAVLGVVLLPYFVFVTRPEDREHRQLKKRLKANTKAKRAGLALVNPVAPLSSVGVFNRVLAQAGSTVAPTRTLIERSGMRLNLGTYLLACGCAAALPFFVVLLVT